MKSSIVAVLIADTFAGLMISSNLSSAWVSSNLLDDFSPGRTLASYSARNLCQAVGLVGSCRPAASYPSSVLIGRALRAQLFGSALALGIDPSDGPRALVAQSLILAVILE